MTDARFYDAASGLLTREAFSFMLDHQLKHAHRAQEFLTLVVFLLERRWRESIVDHQWRDLAVAADDWVVKEMARLIRYAVRNTDLLARTGDGAISLVLVGVDSERARHVIDERLNLQLRRYRLSPTLHINVGSACCPTDGGRADELRAIAARRAAGADATRCLGPLDQLGPPRDEEVHALPLPEVLARRVVCVERRRSPEQRKTVQDN